MYPPWSTTFDAHIHRGRVMHVVVKDQTAELKSEAAVPLDSLAARCKKENGKLEIWVSGARSGRGPRWLGERARTTLARETKQMGPANPNHEHAACPSVPAGVEAAGPPADGGQILPGEKW